MSNYKVFNILLNLESSSKCPIWQINESKDIGNQYVTTILQKDQR